MIIKTKFSISHPLSYHAAMDTLQANLLNWYRHNKRLMPWRGQTNPYKIWVSEVMLQQTQVNTVIPYYRRFIARFPTVESLASASLDDVLKLWEGLGYYARARNMHKAAREIVAAHQGQFPQTAGQLKKLPGFGEYTAGAVASIAFGKPVAAIDGNTKRVISRLFAIKDDISGKTGLNKIKTITAKLVKTTPNPANWNQALMELGAVICTPTNPQCPRCPAGQGLCRALTLGLVKSLPLKRPKKPSPHFDVAAGVIYKNDDRQEFLITRRPLNGMLGGLWEFPGGKQEADESLTRCLQREIKEELALDIDVAEPITRVKHAFTHFKITLHAFSATLQAGTPQKIGVADWAWVTLYDLDRFAFSRADQKVIEVLRQNK